jgi:steroid delta-isomerase-like uncharacterized protein
MVEDTNKNLVRRYYDDYLNRCDLTAVNELFSEDILFHGPEGILRGRAAIAEWITNVHRAFQEFSVTVDFMIGEGDRVVVRDTVRGFHKQPFMEMKASQRRLVLPKVTIFRIAEGKIVELETIYDTQIFVEDLGNPVPLLNKL